MCTSTRASSPNGRQVLLDRLTKGVEKGAVHPVAKADWSPMNSAIGKKCGWVGNQLYLNNFTQWFSDSSNPSTSRIGGNTCRPGGYLQRIVPLAIGVFPLTLQLHSCSAEIFAYRLYFGIFSISLGRSCWQNGFQCLRSTEFLSSSGFQEVYTSI